MTNNANPAFQADPTGRRAALKAADTSLIDDGFPAENALGLAFSGGGIRSATISLGVAQALAKHKRWLDFDYLSTVSGGGYIGSFLTSLYTPHDWRGRTDSPDHPLRAEITALGQWLGRVFGITKASPAPPPLETMPDKGALERQIAFAAEVLTAAADRREVGNPDARPGRRASISNPVHWLREHSRYLAPNGASEFAQIAFIMTRNWLAVLYVLVLPMVVCMALAALLAHGAIDALGATGTTLVEALRVGKSTGAAGSDPGLMLSPWLAISGLCAILALVCGVAYWFTETAWKSWKASPRLAVFALTGFGISGLIGLIAVVTIWTPDSAPLLILVGGGTILGVGGAAAALLSAIRIVWTGKTEFTFTLRNHLTSHGTWWLKGSAIFLLFGLVNTAALALRDSGPVLLSDYTFGTISTTIVIPALVWLSRRLAGSLSDTGKGGLVTFLSRYANLVALLVAILLYGALAIAADTLVQFIAWDGDQVWTAGNFNQMAICAAFSVVLLLAFVTGASTGFINLSSLYNFYASRLSRAYLGATNLNRLYDIKSNITEVRGRDYIDVARYQQQATGAPLHLVNVTLNETVTETRSSIAELDRKGVPLVFAPDGIIVDRGPDKSWNDLSGVEHLSVGQLCAISGAAVSPGMGARSSFGTALALTFANVRMGYWWNSDGALARGKRKPSPLGTFSYMFREMFGRYTRNARRVYLSDGGHFENSGAYELLRRGLNTIIVCDNGADPLYQFEDLENLVRKARLDLGLELKVATGPEVQTLFGTKGAALFLNNGDSNWRTRAKALGESGYALLLKVIHDPGTKDGSRYVIWLKPCRYPEMPEDLHGYALANPTFPQQTTGDQFFDEAQWESYRMLGYSLMDRLLTETLHKTDVFREVARAG